jgi:hypothetical protein
MSSSSRVKLRKTSEADDEELSGLSSRAAVHHRQRLGPVQGEVVRDCGQEASVALTCWSSPAPTINAKTQRFTRYPLTPTMLNRSK